MTASNNTTTIPLRADESAAAAAAQQPIDMDTALRQVAQYRSELANQLILQVNSTPNIQDKEDYSC